MDLTPAQELPPASRRPRPSSVGSDRSRFVSSLSGLADATARVQPGVRPTRRPPLHNLIDDDDKAAVATHADGAAATADVAVPYLAVPAEAGCYASPVSAAWHDISKFCEDFVFFFKFVKNL